MLKRSVSIFALTVGLLSFSTESTAFTIDTWSSKFVAKDYKAALKEAQKADTKEALSIQAWSYFMLDDYGSAMAQFRMMEKEYPKYFDTNLGIAWCGIKLGQYGIVEEYLDRALRYSKRWQQFMVYDARGWLAMKQGDLETAGDHFSMEDRVYQAYQDPAPDYSVSTGWLAIRQGKWDLAKKKFEGGINRSKDCFFCRDGLARVALNKQDYEEALTQTLTGLKINPENGGLQGLLTSSLIGLNDVKRSIEVYKKLISEHEKTAAFVSSLAYVHLAQGDADKAEALFRKALEVEPGNTAAQSGIASMQYRKTDIVSDGWKAQYSGDYEKALKIFSEKAPLALAKRNPSAEDGRGWALLALDRPEEARMAFRAAIDMDPEFFYSSSGLIAAERAVLVLYNQAWSLTNAGRFDEARETFERSRKETPKDMQWLVEDGLAWIDYYKGDADKAEAAFKSIVAMNDKAYLSKTGLGMVALQKKDYATASSMLTASLLQNPYQAISTYITPAKALVDEGQYAQAKELLELAEKTYPSSADIQFLYARAAFGLKDDLTASTKANAAAYLAPSYIDPVFDDIAVAKELRKDGLLSLGWGLYYAGQSEKAIERFDQYFDSGAESVSAYSGRAWAHLAMEQYDKAEDDFEEAMDDKETADGLTGLGWVNLGQEDESDAKRYFLKAQKLIPGYISAQTGLASIQFSKTELVKDGWEAYYKGEYEEALKAFDAQRSAADRKDNPAAEDGRGWTFLAMGKNEDAKKAFKSALKIDKDFTYSQSGLIAAERAALNLYNIAWAQSEAGLFDKAAENFEKARKEAKDEFMWLIDDGLAWIDFYKKDYDKAAAGFAKVIKGTPSAYLSLKGEGFVALKQGKHDEAVKKVVESVLLNPYQAATTYTLPAEDLIKAGKYKQAKELLDLGFKIYPSSADINFQMAKVYVGLNDKKTAGLWAAAAASLAPTYINPAFDDLGLSKKDAKDSLVNLAWGLYFARDNEGALKRFEEAFKAGYDDPNGKRGKAFALFRSGAYKKSIPLLKAAMKLEPKELLPIDEIVPIPGTNQSWTIRYSAASTLAWAYLRSGDVKKAQAHFKDVLQETPFWVDALTGYGYTLLELKDNKRAAEAFTKALGVSPYYPDANQGLKMSEAS
ncbi:tetratricopeptide repeat protein [Magnetovibrio sp. PR-2]|uniref:tetratricopeptide repeat protein n=1 Tax=Magnetovibrio sp. PR-2 TaxID=3120356 RepID=UPI002FCE1B53